MSAATWSASTAAWLLVLGLAGWLWWRARRGPVRSQGPVALIGRLPLEPRRSVYVIRVLDTVLVVGASEAGLSALGELRGAEALASSEGAPLAEVKPTGTPRA